MSEAFGSSEALSATLLSVGGTLVSSDWTPPTTDDLADAIELDRGRFAEAAEAAQDGLEAVYPVTVPPSADASALAGILREARRRDPRALADARVPGAPS